MTLMTRLALMAAGALTTLVLFVLYLRLWQ